MKVQIITFLMVCASTATTKAQFIPPTNPNSIENAYPTAPMGIVSRTLHTSAYNRAMVDYPEGLSNLYVYSWSGASSGIAWRRMDSNNISSFDQGSLQLSPNLQELEVALMADIQGQIYVVASYYKVDNSYVTCGHYYNVYRWNPTGLSLQSVNQISNAPTYGRISIDAHGLYAVAMVWQESTDDADIIKVKVGRSDNNGLTFGNNCSITNAQGGMIPDIAFGHPNPTQTVPIIRISYVDPSGNLVTGNANYSFLMNFSSYFLSGDDINYGAYPSVNSSNSHLYPPTTYSYPNLDCPEHHYNGLDNWSYIYMPDLHNVKARVMTNGTIATYDLSNGSIYVPTVNNVYNNSPTIAYFTDGGSIYYGWQYNYSSSGRRYIAVHLDDNGTPFSLGYQIVANTNDISLVGSIAFAKETGNFWSASAGPNLFSVYAMQNLNYYLKTKLVPWGSPSFRPAPTGVSEKETIVNTVDAYPNPFTDEFTLGAGAGDQVRYQVQLCDISGKYLKSWEGSIHEVNKELRPASHLLPKGLYVIRIATQNFHKSLKIVKQ